jgi:DNA-binding MarR family transcriptional regulator
VNNRTAILEYRKKHPKSTVREIQKALGISSSSVVQHHLKQGEYAGRPAVEIKRENMALRKRIVSLEAALRKARGFIEMFKGKLSYIDEVLVDRGHIDEC